MIRYTVTVKENGDKFHCYNEKKMYEWMNYYSYKCINQDGPWEPHFDIKKETIEEER